jgi:hypothetical protein
MCCALIKRKSVKRYSSGDIGSLSDAYWVSKSVGFKNYLDHHKLAPRGDAVTLRPSTVHVHKSVGFDK